MSAAIEQGFNWLNATRIELEVDTDNHAAIGLYRKLGFVSEGIKRQAGFRNGRLVDVEMMALLRSPRED